VGELGEVLAGTVAGRTVSRQYELARAAGGGSWVPF
jgi:hypothetical protein